MTVGPDKKIIGLCIMRDEQDILNQWLNHVKQWFDPIFILDGSDDFELSKSITEKHPEVVFHEPDSKFFQSNPVDGIRGYLWEEIKKHNLDSPWVGVLHPDEFWHTDPFQHCNDCPPFCDIILLDSVHFFLHSSQRDTWNFSETTDVVKETPFCMYPGHAELRMFRNVPHATYNLGQHSAVTPNGLGAWFRSGGILKQYTYRSLPQILHRVERNRKTGWQPNDFINVLQHGDLFYDTLKCDENFRAEHYPHTRSFYDWEHVHVRDTRIDPL